MTQTTTSRDPDAITDPPIVKGSFWLPEIGTQLCPLHLRVSVTVVRGGRVWYRPVSVDGVAVNAVWGRQRHSTSEKHFRAHFSPAEGTR